MSEFLKHQEYWDGWKRCRFRWTRNHSRQLDAHDYGRDYWVFPVRKR